LAQQFQKSRIANRVSKELSRIVDIKDYLK